MAWNSLSTLLLVCIVACCSSVCVAQSSDDGAATLNPLLVTDKNFSSVALTWNDTAEHPGQRWGMVSLLLFLPSDPYGNAASPHAASAADSLKKLRLVAAAVSSRIVALPALSIQVLWAVCGSLPADMQSCEVSQRFNLDVNVFPTLVIVGPDGNRLDAWERVQLLRQPARHVASHLAALVRPPLRRLYSESDVTALPAAMLEEFDASEQSHRPRSVVFVSSVARTEREDRAFAAVASMLRGLAVVYAVNGDTLYQSLHQTTTKTQPSETAETSSGMVGYFVLRVEDSPVQQERSPALSTKVHHAARKAAVAAMKHHVAVENGFLPRKLFDVIADENDQPHHEALAHVLRSLVADGMYDTVEASNPLHRDFLLTRAPRCTVLHFVPNLFNASSSDGGHQLWGQAPALVAPLTLRTSNHVKYYISRHRRMLKNIRTQLADAACSVTLLDPQGADKDLFISFGYKPSDVFQTSASIREAGGKSFSGKSRDNLIVLSVDGSARFKYGGTFYNAAAVEAFVGESLSSYNKHARSGQRKVTMHSAMPMIGGTSASSMVVAGSLTQYPWCLHPPRSSSPPAVVEKREERLRWLLDAPRWLTTVSFDMFDRLVLGDVTHDSVIVVVDSVSNGTLRSQSHDSLSLRVEAAVARLMLWVSHRHPMTHAALRFVRYALDSNDVPRMLAAHLPLSPLPLTPPYLMYVSRTSKYELMRDGTRNYITEPVVGQPRPESLESLHLTEAEKNAVKVVRVPPSIKVFNRPSQDDLDHERDALRVALQSVSPLQWIFDTRYVESSRGSSVDDSQEWRDPPTIAEVRESHGQPTADVDGGFSDDEF